MVGELSDGELLDRCRGSEHGAWAELVARHQRFVYSVARSNGLDEHDASDVLQITFSELLQQIDKVRDADKLRGWLGVVARRQSWRLRDARRMTDTADVLIDLGELDADIERVAALDDLMAALDELNEPCRQLLERLFLSDRPDNYSAIASDLGIPVGSIGPTRLRCLEKLRVILSESTSVSV